MLRDAWNDEGLCNFCLFQDDEKGALLMQLEDSLEANPDDPSLHLDLVISSFSFFFFIF